MAAPRKDVPQGTLDLLILRLILREPMHGYGVMQRLRLLTDDMFQVTPGSLFPALQRLEENGWVVGCWNASENNRKAKYYEITKSGRKQLDRAEDHWNAVTGAIARVLKEA